MERKLRTQIHRINMKKDDLPLLQYPTPGTASMDLFVANENTIEVAPNETALIPTGLSVELPNRCRLETRNKSNNKELWETAFYCAQRR